MTVFPQAANRLSKRWVPTCISKEQTTMSQNVYEELLEVMKSRGGPYAGLDIPEFFALVGELFTPEEAEFNNLLSRKPAALEEVAV
jgi:hypothetical protein